MVKCRINLNAVLVNKVVNRVADPVHFFGTDSRNFFLKRQTQDPACQNEPEPDLTQKNSVLKQYFEYILKGYGTYLLQVGTLLKKSMDN